MAQRVQKYERDSKQTPDLEKCGLFPKPIKDEQYHRQELSAPVFAFVGLCRLMTCIVDLAGPCGYCEGVGEERTERCQ